MPNTKPECVVVEAHSIQDLNEKIAYFERAGYLLLRVERHFSEFFVSILAVFGSLEFAEYYWRCVGGL